MRVAIVGAGPAGSFAAYELARRGARVTIFDPSHPREKSCGGGVTARALDVVRAAVDAASFPRVAIDAARFVDTSTGDIARVPLDAGALVVASRASFDAALLDAAIRSGATLCRSKVADLAIDDGGVAIESMKFDFVIGADGANSLVRRRVARPFRRDELSIATGYFVRGVTSTEIVLEMTTDPPGYIWSFPRPDHLAVGICAQDDAGIRAEALRLRTRDWIGASGVASPSTSRLDAYSWPIPSLGAAGFARLDPAGSRWCLIGDAAGLVDPITREGIYFAVASGTWAAESLGGSHASFGRTYRSRVHDEAASELAQAARFKAAFFRPSFTGLLLRALNESAAIRGVMADLIAGTQSYRTLKWRLLQTFEIGLAWRALTAQSIRPAL